MCQRTWRSGLPYRNGVYALLSLAGGKMLAAQQERSGHVAVALQ